MRFVYGIILFIVFILILVIYFTNVIFLSGTVMYLFNRSYHVFLPTGLLILIFLSIMFWAILVLLIQSFIKQKPKDIFDEDF